MPNNVIRSALVRFKTYSWNISAVQKKVSIQMRVVSQYLGRFRSMANWSSFVVTGASLHSPLTCYVTITISNVKQFARHKLFQSWIINECKNSADSQFCPHSNCKLIEFIWNCSLAAAENVQFRHTNFAKLLDEICL